MLTKRVNQRKIASEQKKAYIELEYSTYYIPLLNLRIEHGYLISWVKIEEKGKTLIKVYLRYHIDGTSSRSKAKIRWKPSRTLSVSSREIWGVNGEVGVYLVQTTKGRITSVDARRQKLGGVLLIWVM
jgi:small subunit ribosomal protein S8